MDRSTLRKKAATAKRPPLRADLLETSLLAKEARGVLDRAMSYLAVPKMDIWQLRALHSQITIVLLKPGASELDGEMTDWVSLFKGPSGELRKMNLHEALLECKGSLEGQMRRLRHLESSKDLIEH